MPADEKRLYLLTRAVEFEPDELAEQLGAAAYREAIGVLEMISKLPEDQQYYEDRLKFLRDEQAKLDSARQEGFQEGFREGFQQGKLAGRIQALQELLGGPVSTDDELFSQDATALAAQLQALQFRVNGRIA